jgi:hypothetical protein
MVNQQAFLFVDATQAKTSRQGRRNARSFVMRNARRKDPWSTSKNAAKQRKTGSPESTSPKSTGTSDSTLTPNTATPSPPIYSNRPDYFHSRALINFTSTKGEICPDCQIFLCRPGQRLCPRCLPLKPAAPTEDPNNQLFDPFRTSSVEVTRSVSELLRHCKCRSLHIYSKPFPRFPSLWHGNPVRLHVHRRNVIALNTRRADACASGVWGCMARQIVALALITDQHHSFH